MQSKYLQGTLYYSEKRFKSSFPVLVVSAFSLLMGLNIDMQVVVLLRPAGGSNGDQWARDAAVFPPTDLPASLGLPATSVS